MVDRCNFAEWDDTVEDYRQCPNNATHDMGTEVTSQLHGMMADMRDEPDYDLWITSEHAQFCTDHHLPVMFDLNIWKDEQD